MEEELWTEQYKSWKDLKPFQHKLLDEGPKSQSQAWLFNAMWCEWKDLKKLKDTELPSIENNSGLDPWN
tara:strand:+ start:264 stop:470 length:207 start_codon:yes stop_codon:yes gene_type:complete